MNRLIYLLLIATCWSCTNSTTEKYQGKRDKVVNVREKVKEIEMEEALINSIFLFYNMNMDPLIHRYNLNTLQKTGECIVDVLAWCCDCDVCTGSY